MSTLKLLPSDVRSAVRSGIAINSVAQCVEELVYNAVDAGAKTIRIGINLDQFNVRVDDDGNGICEADLEMAGTRYCTSKCHSLADLTNLTYYGFRGEALASIVEVSNIVDIISRPKTALGIELKKKFVDGQRKGCVEKRDATKMAAGTSVIVGKLLSKVPVRQQRIDKTLQIEEVKAALEKILLINPSINLELRNEVNGNVLFSFASASCYADAMNQIFMKRIGFEVKFNYENNLHGKFFLNFSVCNDFVKKKHYQFVYVNNRYIRRCKIHKRVGQLILEQHKDANPKNPDKYPIFMLSITCPFNEYDIVLEPKKETVEFKNLDELFNGVEGLVLKLRRKGIFSGSSLSRNDSLNKSASFISSYDVKGALHSRFVSKNPEPYPTSSCSGSDRGETNTSVKKVSNETRTHNFVRSSPNKRFVNVREVRRKRKLEKKEPRKPMQIPYRPSLSPAVTKPRLTLGALKKFPAWADEFKSGHSTAKKMKMNEKNKNLQDGLTDTSLDQSYYQGNTSARSQSSSRSHNKSISEVSCNETKHVDVSLGNSLKWKFNRFFNSDLNLQSLDDAVMNTPSDKILKDPNDTWGSHHAHSSERRKSAAIPETPWVEEPDMETYVFSKSQDVVSEHFAKNCSLSEVHKDINKRVQKLYLTFNPSTNATALLCAGTSRIAIVTNSDILDSDPGIIDISNSNDEPQAPATASIKTLLAMKGSALVENAIPRNLTPVVRENNSIQVNTQIHLKATSFHNPINFASNPLLSQRSVGFQLENTNSSHESHYDRKAMGEDAQKSFVGSSLTSITTRPSLSLNASSINQGMEPTEVPSLLNLFPIQKPYMDDWNDSMLRETYASHDDSLFPPDFPMHIITDEQGQEWLQTEDRNSVPFFINLSTGESSYYVRSMFGASRQISAGEIQQRFPNKPNWLRKYFPRGFRRFWNGDKREVNKNGDLARLEDCAIGESVKQYISRQNEDESMCKWTSEDLRDVSEYFTRDNMQKNKSTFNAAAIGAGIQSWKDCPGSRVSQRISRKDFDHVNVIGQLDRKFIITAIRASVKESYTIVIFDQHAVHERIRLETLIKESFINGSASEKVLKESEIIPPLDIILTETDIRILEGYAKFFRQAALRYDILSTSTVKVRTVPKCFIDKTMNETVGSRADVLRNLILSLLQELVQKLMETRVTSLHGLPKTVNNVLCSQACRGAIKFGDLLDSETCRQLIEELCKCKNMFQCAHGRPTCVPLINGQDVDKIATNHSTVHSVMPTGTSSTCLPPHSECSSHFCNLKPETLFNSIIRPTTTDMDHQRIPTENIIETLQFGNVLGNREESFPFHSYFNFVPNPNPDETENSPYFLSFNNI